MPPHCVPLLTVTFGFAVLFRSAFVAAMSRTSAGFACQSRATTPTTCGPAIDVPENDAYAESLEFTDDRFGFPGADDVGLDPVRAVDRDGPAAAEARDDSSRPCSWHPSSTRRQ